MDQNKGFLPVLYSEVFGCSTKILKCTIMVLPVHCYSYTSNQRSLNSAFNIELCKN